jgi:hypothetical protein
MDRWLADHGESRTATRALTAELAERLKAVVVHLDEPKWEPFLHDLEVLAPAPALKGQAAPVQRRKYLADAINYFAATDRPRAAEVASGIAAYRDAVHREGLRVASPVLNRQGWPAAGAVIWQGLWVVLLALPALVGTLFHMVPFVVVRFLAARIRTPGRTTVSLYLLIVGVPGYALRYTACGWWMFQNLPPWLAATTLAVMPFLGIVALAYWRGARRAASLAWHQLRFVFRAGRLHELRAQRHALQRQLTTLAAEFETAPPLRRSPSDPTIATTEP